jgi:hypothetical protein
MTTHALLFQRSDKVFDHAVLLRAVLRDQLLSKVIAAHHSGVSP